MQNWQMSTSEQPASRQFTYLALSSAVEVTLGERTVM